eukprot:403372616
MYKLLAIKPDAVAEGQKVPLSYQLQLPIPDTFIFNDASKIPSFYLKTNKQGFIEKHESFGENHVLEHVGDNSDPLHLVAVLKYPSNILKCKSGNDTSLLSTYNIINIYPTLLKSESPCILQKYVRCKGTYTYKVRSMWYLNEQNGKYQSQSFVITNKIGYEEESVKEDQFKYMINPSSEHSNLTTISIIKAQTQSKHNEETYHMISTLTKYLERISNIFFSQIVCDFMKDQYEQWQFLGIVAYKLDLKKINGLTLQGINLYMFTLQKPEDQIWFGQRQETKQNRDKSSRSKTPSNVQRLNIISADKRKCEICQQLCQLDQTSQVLTTKQIYQLDIHTRALGFYLPWLSQQTLKFYDLQKQYKKHSVCDLCMQIYKEVSKSVTVGLKIAKICGMDQFQGQNYMSEQPVENLVRQDEFEGLRKDKVNQINKDKSSKNKSISLAFPEIVSSQIIESQIIIKQDLNTFQQNLTPYRFMIYFQYIDELKGDLVLENLIQAKVLEFQYELFDQVHTINLSQILQQLRQRSHSLNKDSKYLINQLKMHYFLAQSHTDVQNLLQTHLNSINLRLIKNQNTELSHTKYPLKDFKNELVNKKTYYTCVIGHQLQFYLRICIGLDCAPFNLDVSRLSITPYKGIYFGYDKFIPIYPLCEDWMEEIEICQKYHKGLLKQSNIREDGTVQEIETKNQSKNDTQYNCESRAYVLNPDQFKNNLSGNSSNAYMQLKTYDQRQQINQKQESNLNHNIINPSQKVVSQQKQRKNQSFEQEFVDFNNLKKPKIRHKSRKSERQQKLINAEDSILDRLLKKKLKNERNDKINNTFQINPQKDFPNFQQNDTFDDIKPLQETLFKQHASFNQSYSDINQKEYQTLKHENIKQIHELLVQKVKEDSKNFQTNFQEIINTTTLCDTQSINTITSNATTSKKYFKLRNQSYKSSIITNETLRPGSNLRVQPQNFNTDKLHIQKQISNTRPQSSKMLQQKPKNQQQRPLSSMARDRSFAKQQQIQNFIQQNNYAFVNNLTENKVNHTNTSQGGDSISLPSTSIFSNQKSNHTFISIQHQIDKKPVKTKKNTLQQQLIGSSMRYCISIKLKNISNHELIDQVSLSFDNQRDILLQLKEKNNLYKIRLFVKELKDLEKQKLQVVIQFKNEKTISKKLKIEENSIGSCQNYYIIGFGLEAQLMIKIIDTLEHPVIIGSQIKQIQVKNNDHAVFYET